MSLPVLVLIGNMSCTIYLIHLPVFVALSQSTMHWSSWELHVVPMAIVISLALASRYLMEKPLTRRRRQERDTTCAALSPIAVPARIFLAVTAKSV